ncbi:unnamed protein product [Brachionus calyciflorus]|uniref:Bis(monoacylglycero)phosphate synthase CLN5 n=1 Tax=Brachionus calyciflorus TaxID=104777 RepID=A0A813M0Z1_9BILA|nr:unnamed protein product [Brachionus calyciflorus]
MFSSILSIFIVGFIIQTDAFSWPIPYQPVTERPKNDPYCQAGLVPFCPTGKNTNSMPYMEPTDTIEVFALKKPVWSFKYGPLLGYFHIMHDGVGFRNTRTKLNYTMEWYELDQLFNCTFPHLLEDGSLKWCNQGALCVFDGINDTVWNQYGFIEKVTEISGSQFNKFANWSLYDNNTAVYYETWTVYNSNDTNKQIMYFDSFDCASWVLRAFDSLYDVGAKFDPKVKLNYTRLNLYSHEPQLIGNYSQIINSKNQTLINDIRSFYKTFQKRGDYLEQFVEAYTEIFIKKEFYFYYNDLYWYLSLKEPFVKISYYNIPLPGTG